MTDSQVETLSVAMAPEQHRTSPMLRRVPGSSSTLGRSLMFKCEGQSPLTQPDDSFLPVEVNHKNTQPNDEQNGNGQSSMPMQASFLISLQDPVDLLPCVVNIDSD